MRCRHAELLTATEALKDDHWFQGRSGRTILLAFKALALAFLHKSETKEVAKQLLQQCDGTEGVKLLVPIGNLCLGMAFLDECQFTKADKCLKKAQVTCDELMDPLLRPVISRQINYYRALAYTALEQYSEAEHCLVSADAVDRQYINRYVLQNAAVAYELGRISALRGEPADALARLEKALSMYQQAEHVPGIVASMSRMASVYLSLKDAKNALSTYQTMQSVIQNHNGVITSTLASEINTLATALQVSLMPSASQS